MTEQQTEPSSYTGTFHTHRWLRFGPDGQRDVAEIRVFSDGLVHISEQAINQLLVDAGFSQRDPDPVEVAAAKRLSWARSRLQDGLNAMLNGRAD